MCRALLRALSAYYLNKPPQQPCEPGTTIKPMLWMRNVKDGDEVMGWRLSHQPPCPSGSLEAVGLPSNQIYGKALCKMQKTK